MIWIVLEYGLALLLAVMLGGAIILLGMFFVTVISGEKKLW